jgi:hypothetical protein
VYFVSFVFKKVEGIPAVFEENLCANPC